MRVIDTKSIKTGHIAEPVKGAIVIEWHTGEAEELSDYLRKKRLKLRDGFYEYCRR